MANTIEIIINAESAGAERNIQRTAQHISSVEAAARGASSAVSGWISNMTSSMAGFLAAGLIERIASGIASIGSGMISTNAALETTGKVFETQFGNASKNVGRSASELNAMVAAATEGARDKIVAAQQDMANAVEDHEHRVQSLGASAGGAGTSSERAVRDAQRTFERSMAEIEESHAEAMAKLRDDTEQSAKDWTRSMTDRSRAFDRSMSDLEVSHSETMRRLRGDVDELISKEAEGADKRRNQYAEDQRTAADSFTAQRSAATRKAADLQRLIDEETAKGSGGDQDLLASLRERLDQEKALQGRTFAQYRAGLVQKQADEETQAQSAAAKARAAMEQRIADENAQYDRRRTRLAADYAEQVTRAQETHQRETESLTKRLADEDKQFEKAKAKEAERLADSIQRAAEANVAIGGNTGARAAEEQRMWERTLEERNQAIIKARADYVKSVEEAARRAQQGINETPALMQRLAEYVGRPLTTAREQGEALMKWIRDQARNVPFEIPGLTDLGRRLNAARLDVTSWFTVVADTAAGANKPLDQVANAITRLASGDTGEAGEALRDIGVNIREISGLQFDAQGMLLTPVNEALPRLRQALIDRFGGMSREMMNTWQGLVSNAKVAWQEFELALGKPVFGLARQGLSDLLGWLDKNQASVQQFAITVGTGLADGFKAFVGWVREAKASIEDWLGKDDNQLKLANLSTAIGNLGTTLAGMGLSAGNAGNILGTIVDVTTAVANGISYLIGFVKKNELSFAALAAAGGVAIAMLTGPVGILPAIGLAGVGIGLFADSVSRWWGDITRQTETMRASIAAAFDPGNSQSIVGFMNRGWENTRVAAATAWEGIKKTVGGIMRSIVEGIALMVNSAIDSLNALIERVNSVIGGINAASPVKIGLIGKLGAWNPELPAFANGGAFTVGGSGGTDSQLVQFLASPGERVTVSPEGRGAPPVIINITGPVYGADDLVDRVHSGLLEKQRRNGALGFA
jgi:hypothetical protein